MKYRDENGDFQDLYFKTGDTLPIGTIVSYGSTTPPTNWLVCDGSAVSRTTYADLFAVIGTTFGTGDGSTTFNLPDLRGRVGVGKSSDTEFDTLGETGGSKSNVYDLSHTHTQGSTGSTVLTTEQIPSHNHGAKNFIVNDNVFNTLNVGSGSAVVMIGNDNTHTDNTGGGQGHTHTNPTTNSALGNTNISTLQPYIVTNYIIKAYQAAGVVANVTNIQNDSTKDTYSCDYINDAIDTAVEDAYSTTEVKTNKVWTNNKPIYRKTIFVEVQHTGAATTRQYQTAHNISNVDTIWIDETHSFMPDTSYVTGSIQNTYVQNGEVFYWQRVKVGRSNIVTEVAYINDENINMYVTLEYTKTTD